MTNASLDELARRYGIALSHHGFDGERIIPDDTKRVILSGLGIAAGSDADVAASLADAEGRQPPLMRPSEGNACHVPAWLAGRRAWGISAQLYELRSRRNWGIGDFADLELMCRIAGEAGADFVGVNPLHALFLSQPGRCSPFFPSNRHFLNPLYIAVDRVPGYDHTLADRETLERLRGLDAVDYDGVAALKLAALSRLHQGWQGGEPAAPFSKADFAAFMSEAGVPLQRHALFEALSHWRTSLGEGSGWTAWPAGYADVGGDAVAGFAARHEEEIDFYAWLQWIARTQLAQTQAAALDAGMRIGLYLDFAVGEAPDGSASWSDRAAYVSTMNFGAPPDMFTADGQDWGLTPLSPIALAAGSCARFKSLMAAGMTSAGALRIDHVMSLWQLFFVPKDGRPADGTYVRYPIEKLLAALAELSAARRTLVIGEDLGVVPNGFRDVMQASSILSYRILYFERDGQGFFAPDHYPELALACLSTHDLPTLRGWWAGDDVDLRLEHGLIDSAAAGGQRDDRSEERWRIMRTFAAAGCIARQDLTEAEAKGRDVPADFALAAHRFIARTRSMLAGVRLADLMGERKPTNLPGTVDSYPNWRLKLAVDIEDLPATELFRSIAAVVAAERPKSP